MPQTINSTLAETTDFWTPPLEHVEASGTGASRERLVCSGCDSEFVFGSRYCHVCGAERESKPRARKFAFNFASVFSRVQLGSWTDAIGLNPAAFVSFVVGIGCIIAGLLTGVLFYQPQTTFDWQAAQMWRVEWMLGGIAAFLAGILLRKD